MVSQNENGRFFTISNSPYRNEGESLRGTINNLQTEINKLKMENTKLKESPKGFEPKKERNWDPVSIIIIIAMIIFFGIIIIFTYYDFKNIKQHEQRLLQICKEHVPKAVNFKLYEYKTYYTCEYHRILNKEYVVRHMVLFDFETTLSPERWLVGKDDIYKNELIRRLKESQNE